MLRTLKKRYHETNLIRQAVDACPDGICMAEEDGRPILANRTINELSLRLTGHTVLNAAVLWGDLTALAAGEASGMQTGGTGNKCIEGVRNDLLLLRLEDGAAWQFRRRELAANGEKIWQYEASDVTQLVEYRERLRENNLRAEQMNERQRELLRGIVRNNEEKERLHAKMRIHDSLGQVLLMTKMALESGEMKDGEALFAAWEDVVEDMENAAKKQRLNSPLPEEELLRVAAMIECRVVFSGRQPGERKAILLLYAAIREALTNAVRHAGAEELFVDIREEGKKCRVRIHDNGKREVREPLQEGGGLSTLRKRLESEGAGMTLETADGVVMLLTIPKE